MRVRKLSATGDYTFGQSQGNFYANTPATVAQCVKTRLGLITGEWFLDTSEGTPWDTQVVGYNTAATRDLVIKETILNTLGVASIDNYSSSFDPGAREFNVVCDIFTIFSTVPIAFNESFLPQ